MTAAPATQPRKWFPTKAAWADDQVAQLRARIEELPRANTHDTRGIRQRMQAIEHLRNEVRRMEKIAEHFRQRGQ